VYIRPRREAINYPQRLRNVARKLTLWRAAGEVPKTSGIFSRECSGKSRHGLPGQKAGGGFFIIVVI
jgi:hypothetical protein